MDHKTIIQQAILDLARKRGKTKSFCPSEIARMLFPDDWRPYMGLIREITQDLADQGIVLITQKGQTVHTKAIKGPIRIQLA